MSSPDIVPNMLDELAQIEGDRYIPTRDEAESALADLEEAAETVQHLNDLSKRDRSAARQRLKLYVAGIVAHEQTHARLGSLDEDEEVDRVDSALRVIETVHGLAESTRKLARAVRIARNGLSEGEHTTIRTVAPQGMELPEGLVVPGNYDVNGSGVKRIDLDKDGIPVARLVSRTFFAPVARIDSPTSTDIVFAVSSGIGSRFPTIGADVATDGRALTRALAPYGGGFTTAEGDAAARYVADFRRVNQHRMPRATKVMRTGWQGPDGAAGFVAGLDHLHDGGEERLGAVEPHRWQGRTNVLHIGSMDQGRREVLEAVQRSGTLEGWLAAASSAADCPVPMAMVGAAFAATLLAPLQLDPFVVDAGGITSSGKTTSARLAAAVWGYPDTAPNPRTGAPAGIWGWTSTVNAIEIRASMRFDIPIVMDDTKTIMQSDPGKLVRQVVYGIANGSAKARGTQTGGIREARSFRTVLLTTGEKPLTSWTNDPGTRARVLSITDRPFPENDRKRVEQIKATVLDDYGHAGPAFVRWLLEERARSDLAPWRDYLDRYTTHLQADCEGAGSRLARHGAALLTALEMATRAMPGFTYDRKPVEAMLVEIVRHGHEEADQPREAMRDVLTWVGANRLGFWGPHAVDVHHGNREVRVPNGGWYGRWEFTGGPLQQQQDQVVGTRRTTQLGIVGRKLDEVLLAHGYDPGDIVGQWHARGWLHTGCGRNRARQVAIDGSRVRCLVIRPDIIEQEG